MINKNKPVQCIQCSTRWTEFNRDKLLEHYFYNHQGNLSFLSEERLLTFVKQA